MVETRLKDVQFDVLNLAKCIEVGYRRSAVDQQLLIAFGEDLDAAPVFQIGDYCRVAFDDYGIAGAGGAQLAGDELNRKRLLRIDRRVIGQ
ncbi:hypothetical protein D3C85_1010700 [compost metagenome]